jgi:hypothetical protein
MRRSPGGGPSSAHIYHVGIRSRQFAPPAKRERSACRPSMDAVDATRGLTSLRPKWVEVGVAGTLSLPVPPKLMTYGRQIRTLSGRSANLQNGRPPDTRGWATSPRLCHRLPTASTSGSVESGPSAFGYYYAVIARPLGAGRPPRACAFHPASITRRKPETGAGGLPLTATF